MTKKEIIVDYLERSQLLEFLIISIALAISITLIVVGFTPLSSGGEVSIPLVLIGMVVLILATSGLGVVITRRKKRKTK